MYNFGKSSREHLDTCHEDIQYILNKLIQIYDFSVLEGLRSTERQQELFNDEKSQLDGINKKSKHQSDIGVSMAVDIMPWKKGTNAFSGEVKDASRFYYMMGMVRSIAEEALESGMIKHGVRFGLDWDSDDVFDDQNFDDLPHFELVKLGL